LLRLFPQHEIRRVEELDGEWEFEPVDRRALPTRYRYRLPVPGAWESHPAFRAYRGLGAYRRRVMVRRSGPVRLTFKGVSHTAQVFWDGVPVGGHYNAYTPFDVFVTAEAGSHRLEVLVDNRFSEASRLHLPNDYYTYGGLIRPVALAEVPPLHLDRLAFVPALREGGWQATLAATLRNVGDTTLTGWVRGELAGRPVLFDPLAVPAGGVATVRTHVAFDAVDAWSAERPALYLWTCRLWLSGEEGPIDDLTERVGFRTVGWQDGVLRVNGQPVRLRGFNRHEDHPTFGAALPYPLMAVDLSLMAEMGANAVRTSHYPNDERFLDLCDERGFYVFEENHARGFDLATMQQPRFQEQAMACNREMVTSHRNHPAIIVWGLLNECASDSDAGRALYAEQIAQIRAMDPSRPVTFASHHRERDRCLDLADIVSLNLYPLWYTDEDPKALLDAAVAWAARLGGPGKPLLITEFGADGFYGFHDATWAPKGSEDRQAAILAAQLAAFSADPRVAGAFIWQFADCRVTEGTGWLLSRAMTRNAKGVVDGFRRPKMAYDTVRRAWCPDRGPSADRRIPAK
jgi:beta-glucuronidase